MEEIMETVLQFWDPEIFKINQYPFENFDFLKRETDQYEKFEDGYVEKLVKQVEQGNRFQNSFEVETY